MNREPDFDDSVDQLAVFSDIICTFQEAGHGYEAGLRRRGWAPAAASTIAANYVAEWVDVAMKLGADEAQPGDVPQLAGRLLAHMGMFLAAAADGLDHRADRIRQAWPAEEAEEFAVASVVVRQTQAIRRAGSAAA
jgi:hypothetical protein